MHCIDIKAAGRPGLSSRLSWMGMCTCCVGPAPLGADAGPRSEATGALRGLLGLGGLSLLSLLLLLLLLVLLLTLLLVLLQQGDHCLPIGTLHPAQSLVSGRG